MPGSTIINTILMAGAFQGFLLGTLLFFRKGNIVANKILSGIILVFSLSITLHTLSHSKIISLPERDESFISLLFILAAPLIFLYVRTLTVPGFAYSKIDVFHFLPFVLSTAISSVLFFCCPELPLKFEKVIGILSFIVFSFYILFSDFLLWEFSKVIKNNYSRPERKNLVWLRIFLFLLTDLWIAAGIIDVFFKSVSWNYIWFLSCLLIYIIGYYCYIYPEVFSAPDIGLSPAADSVKKYKKSSLTKEMAEEYLIRLNKTMNDRQLYLDDNLTLAALAREVGISSHHLSQIINENIGLSFYDYINSQRIGEAKKMLSGGDCNSVGIAVIAYDVGFNSISAFNTAFKKFTNTTPSVFRKKKQENP